MFYLLFPLRCRQASIVSAPVSKIPAINYHLCCCYVLSPVSLVPAIKCYRRKMNCQCHGIAENHQCQRYLQFIIAGSNDTGLVLLTHQLTTYRRCQRSLVLLPLINYCQRHCSWRKIYRQCPGIDENPRKGLITGVTSDNLSPVSLTPVKSLSPVPLRPVNKDKYKVANNSKKFWMNFRKNLQWPQWDAQGPAGNLFIKNLNSEISCQYKF